ncbi:MAG TPA: hypothetical protein VK066_12685 [Chloroflexota bacterium]|nr:hypothetical protein [Chloroflexota bacterium]
MLALIPTVFLVFLELAVGGVALLAWADWRREVSRGFLLLSAVTLWLSGAIALWVREAFPLSITASPWRAVETPVVIAFLLLLGAYTVWVWRGIGPGRHALVGLAALAGFGALGAAAFVHASVWGPLPTLVSLLLGAAGLGGSGVGMMLGHWYLVTPNLSTRPLVVMTLAFLVAAALQGALLPLELGAAGASGEPAAGAQALLGGYPLAFILRVVVGIVLPVALGIMTYQTCRLRSMMSATGLLYIAVSCVLAGEVIAKTLFFLTGVPI